MKGLLDFASTPAGQGLLAAAFGGLAGARRGQPINSIGRAGLAGLAGYSGAQDRVQQQEENAVQKQLRDMQMTQMREQMEKQKGQQAWREGLPAVQQQATQPTYGAGDEGPTMTPANPNALMDYAMKPNSPFADEILKNRLFPGAADYLTVDGTVLQKTPSGLTPVYTATPKPAGDPTKVQEFKFAQANGYKGTFDQYVTLGPTIMANAQAPLRNAQVANIEAENDYNLPPPRPSPPSGQVTVNVSGRSFVFPNAAAANQFKAKAGVK